MTECDCIRLIKQGGPMDGGLESTRYACEKCGASYHVKPSEITVLYGKPAKEPADPQ